MRVALLARAVFPLHGYGGLERHVYDLARALIERSIEVTLITPPPADPGLTAAAIHPAITAEFVPYRTFPMAGRRGTTVLDRSTAYPVWGLRAGRRALELVRDGRIDIVHGFGASVLGYARSRRRERGHQTLGGTAAAESRAATAPLVMNPQGLEEFGATDPSRAPLKVAAYFPLRRAVRLCAEAADAVIATDRSLEPYVLQHLGIARERMATIPNALDLRALDRDTDPAVTADVRDRHGVAPDERILLSVGRLEANKGYHVLVRALAAVREHGSLDGRPWRWVSLGDGPYRPTLDALVAETGLQSHAQFLGRVSDREMHAWHELATVFVHPTLYEGSSLVTLEAMAHRRAVVASAAGGIPDKVRPGENGWLVPPGDTSALAAAISGAVSDPARLERYGLAGRAIVERQFSWDAAGDATVELYRHLLG